MVTEWKQEDPIWSIQGVMEVWTRMRLGVVDDS